MREKGKVKVIKCVKMKFSQVDFKTASKNFRLKIIMTKTDNKK